MIRLPYGRILSACIALAAIAVAAVAFEEKRNSAIAAAEVVKLKRQIAVERDRIADLKAEWALLDQPERLQGIATRYASVLHLQLLDPVTQIATLSDIPARPAAAPEAAGQPAKGDAGTPVASAPAAPRQGDAIDALLSGGAGNIAPVTTPAAAPAAQPAANTAGSVATAPSSADTGADDGEDVPEGVGSIDDLLSGDGTAPAAATGHE